jgi:tetratricopeptide (TPR) repeat protein
VLPLFLRNIKCCFDGRGSSCLLAGLVSFTTLIATAAHAEHQIDVQRKSAEGDHFRALAVYELLPNRGMNYATKIAAGESAWALGDVRRATAIFDSILRENQVSPEERAKILFSRGVIEFQEQRYQESTLFAEKAVKSLMKGTPLRVRAELLWGQALTRAKRFVTAEETLVKALKASGANDRPEIALSLAEVYLQLGKLEDATKILKVIPADHEYAGRAVRLLSQISVQMDQGARARFWIEKGREGYREAFLDSWADFSLASIALKQGDLEVARSIVEGARNRYPPSDRWLVLIEARLEQAEWSNREKGIRR